MAVWAKLYFDPGIAVGRDLIALDNGQIQRRLFPILAALATDLDISANKADSRNTSSNVRNFVIHNGIVRRRVRQVQSLRGRERKGAASAKNNNRKNKYQKWFCRRIHSFPSSNFFDFYSFGRVAETREF